MPVHSILSFSILRPSVRSWTFVAAFVALAAAAGCAAPQAGPAPGDETTANDTGGNETAGNVAPDNATTAIPIVQNEPDARAASAPQADSKKSDTPSESDLQAARRHHPDELIGLTPNGVRDLLGTPSLVRHDLPAQVWQYRTADCVLDLYLYPPAAAGKSRSAKQAVSDSERTVVYYELRDKNAKPLAGNRCFVSIVAARAARSG